MLNLPAWVRKTPYNIIWEQNRRQQGFAHLEDDILSDIEQSPVHLTLEGDLTIMAIAFRRLPRNEQNLLNLKFERDFWLG